LTNGQALPATPERSTLQPVPMPVNGTPPALAPYDAGWQQTAAVSQTVSPRAVSPVSPPTAPLYGSSPTGAGRPAAPAQPLWEVGVIGTAAYMPDYPAADHNSAHYLPMPMIIYRGAFLRAGDKGLLRGRLIHTRDLEFEISLNGSFPTDSDDNDTRRGMPDLDWLGEIGPRLQWTVARAARDAKIDLELPVRAVFSTDFHSDISYRGVVIAPEIAYQNSNFLNSQVAVKAGLSSTFASEDLQDYFYEVSAPYATANRAVYDAQAGYLGSKVQLSLYAPLTPWVGLRGMGQVNFHQGAANQDSPLFKDETTYGVGMALTMTLAKSKQTAAP
jgi:outer membrane scaffolding protein for murein synthesis (MipA/OmpV family)